jgi:hypothetical protein
MPSALLRIEARRSVALLLLPVLLGLAWFSFSAGSGAFCRRFLWIEVSVAVRNTAFFAAPCLAGAAAWLAGRERRRGMGELLGTVPQNSLCGPCADSHSVLSLHLPTTRRPARDTPVAVRHDRSGCQCPAPPPPTVSPRRPVARSKAMLFPPAAPPPTSNARREFFFLMALGLLAFAAAWRFALFDRLVEAARRLEGLPADALVHGGGNSLLVQATRALP